MTCKDTTLSPARAISARSMILSGCVAFGMTLALAGTMQLRAQGIAAHDTQAPVNYDAGSIELQDRQQRVALSGGVTITQGPLTVRSQRMIVNYTDNGSLDIGRIVASGGVNVSRGIERARGDTAIYDFGRRIITMAGNVTLNRGGDTLSGARLVIDLERGISSVDGRPSAPAGGGGRVTGTFTVPQTQD